MNLNLSHGFRAVAVAIVALAFAPAAAHASTVTEYPQEVRTLSGWWANEHVPAYKCPSSQPFLEKHNYAPVGTSLIPGVSINEEYEPWPIGVSITLATPGFQQSTQNHYAVGIHPIASSVTNWTFGTSWYQVVLHCTADPSVGYRVDPQGAIVL